MTNYDYYLKGWQTGFEPSIYIPDFPTSSANRAWGIGLNDQRGGTKRNLQELEQSQDWADQVINNTCLQSMKLRTAINNAGIAYDIYLYWDGTIFTFNVCREGETRPIGSYNDAKYLCDAKGLKESDFYYIRIKL